MVQKEQREISSLHQRTDEPVPMLDSASPTRTSSASTQMRGCHLSRGSDQVHNLTSLQIKNQRLHPFPPFPLVTLHQRTKTWSLFPHSYFLLIIVFQSPASLKCVTRVLNPSVTRVVNIYPR